MKAVKLVATAALLIGSVLGDLYVHFPRGSNDRNRERNDNRNNGNRLFDSQNNDKGGYAWAGDATLSGVNDPLTVFPGSILPVEWTAQHSCGPDSNALCNVIIQYACDDVLPYIRDGYPTGDLTTSDDDAANNPQYQRRKFASTGQNADEGTNTIPCPQNTGCDNQQFNSGQLTADQKENLAKFYAGETVDGYIGVEFGYHETWDYYYEQCLMTERNQGLYTADQKLGGTRAKFTRQNPNGNRRGLECPEERDYYPYWQWSPWTDIAILTTDTAWCPYYQAESQNVKPRMKCNMTEGARQVAENGLAPIDEAKCQSVQGKWVEADPNFVAKDPPACMLHDISRDNHLGNVGIAPDNSGMDEINPLGEKSILSTETQAFNWVVPDEVAGKNCVVRVRYNISNSNYPQVNAFSLEAVDPEDDTAEPFFDYRFNCPRITISNGDNVDDVNVAVDDENQCGDKLTDTKRPLYNRPYVKVWGKDSVPKLSLAINTNQVGRTFQDRTYVLNIKSASDEPDMNCDRIFNLGYRGKRGNIVQTYPAVEFDFVPNKLEMNAGDCAHIQFLGSDFSPNRNPNNAEGWRYGERTNMVQSDDGHNGYPSPVSRQSMWADEDTAIKMAFAGIEDLTMCEEFQNGDDNEDNAYTNCGKLNPAPAHFDAGLFKFNVGTYHYISTRNNNHSNRSHMGQIKVSNGGLSSGAIAGIAIGSVAVVGAVAVGSIMIAKRRGSKMR